MPMHDWSRVPGWLWHQMQLGWVLELSHELNRTLPPVPLYALIEYATAPPDSSLSFDIPDTAFDGLDDESHAVAKRRTVAVRGTGDHRKVALVGVLSPGIARSAPARAAFIEKSVAALKYGLGLLVVEPFPMSEQNPNSVPSALWEALTGNPFVSLNKPLALASFRPGQQPEVYLDPVEVGDTLPNMPLFLNVERYVNLPLEATYMAAWQTFPAEWRNVIAGT